MRDLRISVTDHCNFRCVYCMPKAVFGTRYHFVGHEGLLTFEEIERFARQAALLGVTKIRLTGGEPLLRPHLEDLVAKLSHIQGIEDLALTTNASTLTPQKAAALRAAGLQRINISLDALDEDIFQKMNDVGFPVARVLQAIDDAAAAGLRVKINMVVRRNLNDSQIVPMAEHFRGTGHTLRFIEYMDVGNLNGWQRDDVVTAQEILSRIGDHWPLEPVNSQRYGEVATRYRYVDGQGEIGVISSISQPFCGSCTRARLSPEGQLYTCLFGTQGHDLRALLRSGATDEEIYAALAGIWRARDDRYSELRASTAPKGQKVEMFHIGG
jgi:cyclic pyranopterin phosphate synthase